MKIACLNDSHLGAKSDSENFYNVQRHFFEQVFFPYLIQNNITHILHLGDLFDRRKYINFKTLNFFNECFLKPLEKNNITMDIIVGNHDVFHKNTNVLNSPELLIQSDNVNVFIDPLEKEYGGKTYLLCPWICKENITKFNELRESTKAKICFGHFDFAGFDMMPGVKSFHGFPKKDFKKFEKVFSGHYHTKSDDGHIHYLGVQYEITWADYNDQKGFHVFDTELDDIEFIHNPKKWHHKLFYDDTKPENLKLYKSKKGFEQYQNCYVKLLVEKKDNPSLYEKFLTTLNNSGIEDLKVIETDMDMYLDDLEDYLEDEEMKDEMETSVILKKYVDDSDSHDKDLLQSIISSVYSEALLDAN